jgi:hypothetical protein
MMTPRYSNCDRELVLLPLPGSRILRVESNPSELHVIFEKLGVSAQLQS